MPRPFNVNVPSLNNRVSAWQEIQNHVLKGDAPRLRPTVTLSREFGCMGYELADVLQAKLEEASGEKWNIYDKELLEIVAREEGIDLEILNRLGETARSFEKLGLTPPEYHHHAEAFRALARRLVQFATLGNAIILGRGGAVLCQALSNCTHVRVEAPLEWRVKSIVARLSMGPEEARHFVLSHGSARELFMREQLRVEPHERSFFNLTFNNEKSSVTAMAGATVAYLRETWASQAYFRA